MPRSKFSYRALTSVLLLWSFILVVGSGVLLYVAPRCRIADVTGWQVLALDKGHWEAIHTVMSIVFLAGGILHLFKFNRRTVGTYVRRSREELSPFRWPLIIATVVVAGIMVGTIAGVPPFSTVMDVKDEFHEGRDLATAPQSAAAFEQLSLRQVALRAGVDPEAACSALRDAGVDCASPDAGLVDLAETADRSPVELYRQLETAFPAGGWQGGQGRGRALPGIGRRPASEARSTPDSSEDEAATGETTGSERYLEDLPGAEAPPREGAGEARPWRRRPGMGRQAGWGRLTVAQLATQLSVPVQVALERLRDHGIEAARDDQVRDLADRYGVRPSDLPVIIETGSGRGRSW